MNRRSFITKALAGLAAIPLLGKLAELVRPDSGNVVFGWAGPRDWPRATHFAAWDGKPTYVAWGPIDQIDRIYVDGRQVWPDNSGNDLDAVYKEWDACGITFPDHGPQIRFRTGDLRLTLE